MGYKILDYAIGLVFRHFGDALRLSALPYLIQCVATLAVAFLFPMRAANGHFDASFVAASFVVGVISVVMGLWIAVAWHRYVLLDEMPGAYAPRFNGNRILAYFGNSIILGLIAVVLIVIASVILGLLVAALSPTLGNSSAIGLFIGPFILIYFPIAVLMYRLGLILPASAVGKPIRMGGAWAATRGATGAILALAFLSVLAVLVLSIPGIFWPGSWFATVWGLLVGWVEVVVGVSILTTLYGYYVEKRTIPGLNG